MPQFLGFVSSTTLAGSIIVRSSSGVPTDSSSAPTYRIYGSAGLMTNGTGSLTSYKDSGSITGATNVSPIVVTSIGHGLTTGTRVTISGVGGNTAANSTYNVTVLTSNTFSLDSSTGNGAYTSGGTWHVSGLYNLSVSVSSSDGYAAGETYTLLVTSVVSGTTIADTYTFIMT